MNRTKKGKTPAKSEILFADAAVEAAEAPKSLPAKFKRMLRRLKLEDRVKKKRVGIKMHFGGNLGYTTIHPVFMRILVQELKDAGAKSIKAMDNDPQTGIVRGYLPEILGCPTVSCFGKTMKSHTRIKIGYKGLDIAEVGKEALNCDFFLDLSHVKGHGDCGFGGALKNIAMGVVPPSTRRKLHGLEGGLVYHEKKCSYCYKCMEACPREAVIRTKDGKGIWFFYHNCTYCQHCAMVCPEGAIRMENRRFQDFSRGMAKLTSAFLRRFKPANTLFINFLTNITVYCDCWGMSTPSLVPDIGIMASNDIVAIETASLDKIKTKDLLPNGLPKNRKLLSKGKHLFERIHGKDPYLMVKYLKKEYGGTDAYVLKTIR